MTDTSFSVVARGKSGFDVEMAKPDGRRKTVPGFRSEHEASAWIIQAKRMIRDAGPWTPLVPRKPTARTIDEPPQTPSSLPIEQQPVREPGNGTTARRVRAKAIP